MGGADRLPRPRRENDQNGDFPAMTSIGSPAVEVDLNVFSLSDRASAVPAPIASPLSSIATSQTKIFFDDGRLLRCATRSSIW